MSILCKIFGHKWNEKRIICTRCNYLNEDNLKKSIQSNDNKSLIYLFSKGLSPDYEDESGATLLEIAFRSEQTEIIKLLINAGAKVNVTYYNYYNSIGRIDATPLHIACEKGYIEIVKQLIKSGANVNDDARWEYGSDQAGYETPLDVAFKKRNKDIMIILAKAGAKPSSGFISEIIEAGLIEIAEELIKPGANVVKKKECEHNVNAPIIPACKKGYLKIVQKLILAGADVDRKALFPYGKRPLHISCEKENLEIVSELIKGGAKVNSTDDEGITPIQIASAKNNDEIYKLLLQSGARI